MRRARSQPPCARAINPPRRAPHPTPGNYHASENLRANRQIVIAAVQHCGCALDSASDDLKADREIVLVAVQNDATSLKYASRSLRGDREIVLAAVRENHTALSERRSRGAPLASQAVCVSTELSD